MYDKTTPSQLQNSFESWLKELKPEEWLTLGEAFGASVNRRPSCIRPTYMEGDEFNDWLMWHFGDVVFPKLRSKKKPNKVKVKNVR